MPQAEGWWDAGAEFQEDSQQRRAAAWRAVSRPLLPGDNLEVYAIEHNQFGALGEAPPSMTW